MPDTGALHKHVSINVNLELWWFSAKTLNHHRTWIILLDKYKMTKIAANYVLIYFMLLVEGQHCALMNILNNTNVNAPIYNQG